MPPRESPSALISLWSRRFAPFAGWARQNPLPLAVLGCVALFLVYAAFRQRYIFGVDSFGYYQLGWNFAHGRVYLETALPAVGHPALVPLGFSLNAAQQVVPNYPPGFPLLIAIGQLFGVPLLVTPILGVVSCLVLYRLLRLRATVATAGWLTVAWAFMPLTVYGSTLMMSDLVAATVLMGALLAWRTRHTVLAAWLLGFSFTVRPTNVFFLVPFLLELRLDRRSLVLLLHLAVPCALYGLYNHLLFGAPWRTGYGDFFTDLRPVLFPSHFAFYAKMTFVLLGPVVVLLALLGLRPWTTEKTFLLLWPLSLMLFFANWAGGQIDAWWWARFILPGFPAFFLLAADGLEFLRRKLAAWHLGATACTLLLLAAPINSIVYGAVQGDLWILYKGTPYRETARFVAAEVPPGSAVGSVELTASLYVYTKLIPFVSVADRSPDLVGELLSAGRPVYLLVEPWNADNDSVREIFRRYRTREVTRFPELWRGLPLYEVTLPPVP